MFLKFFWFFFKSFNVPKLLVKTPPFHHSSFFFLNFLFFFNSLLLSATSRCFCFHFTTSSLTSFSSISLKPSSLIGFCSKTEVSFRIVSQFLGFFLREISKLFLFLYVLKTMWKLLFKSKHTVQWSDVFLGRHWNKHTEKCSCN